MGMEPRVTANVRAGRRENHVDTVDHRRRLLRRQIEDLWGRGDLSVAAELYDERTVDHMPIPGQAPGPGALAEVVRAFHAAFADLAIEVHGVLADGDLAADFWTFTGTHTGVLFGRPPTGRRVRFCGLDMVRIAAGRVHEIWHVEDLLSMNAQLDGITPDVGRPRAAAPPPPLPAPTTAAPLPAERRAHHLALARRHLEDLWGRRHTWLVDEPYSPQVIDHNPAPGQRPGVAGLLDVLAWLHEAVPDLSLSPEAYVADGEYVCDRWTLTGTHTGGPLLGLPARGARLRFHGMDVVRIGGDGRITDVWHAEEFWRMKAQMAAA
jgi:predicted ester cyclase